MILTDKAKEDFKEWVFENYYFQDLNVLYPLHLIDTLIIEFFDEQKIIILIDFIGGDFCYTIKDYLTSKSECKKYYGLNYKSRQEVGTQAIKKANEIYNERFK